MSCHSDYWQNSKQFSKEIRSVHIYINLQLSVTYEISYKITTTSFSIIKFLLLHYNIRLVRYFCSQVLMYSIEGSLNFPAYVSLHQLSGQKKIKKIEKFNQYFLFWKYRLKRLKTNKTNHLIHLTVMSYSIHLLLFLVYNCTVIKCFIVSVFVIYNEHLYLIIKLY